MIRDSMTITVYFDYSGIDLVVFQDSPGWEITPAGILLIHLPGGGMKAIRTWSSMDVQDRKTVEE